MRRKGVNEREGVVEDGGENPGGGEEKKKTRARLRFL